MEHRDMDNLQKYKLGNNKILPKNREYFVPTVLSDAQIGAPYKPNIFGDLKEDVSYMNSGFVNFEKEPVNLKSNNMRITSTTNRNMKNSNGILFTKPNKNYNMTYVKNENKDFRNEYSNRDSDDRFEFQSRYVIGNPIPLPYMERSIKKSAFREISKKPVTIKPRKIEVPIDLKDTQHEITAADKNNLKKIQYIQKKTVPEDRLIEITIRASDEKDVVRICKSLLEEYSRDKLSTFRIILIWFLPFIVASLIPAVVYFLI
ncbi:hypothetical protein QEN19_000769 [Hanseniaspora menglaensis]